MRPHPRGQGVGPLVFIFGEDFFIIFSKMFRGLSGHFENICFLHIKQHHDNSAGQSGLVPFKSYKLESKTRAKVFGKVVEAYLSRGSFGD